MAKKKPNDYGTGIPLHEVEALARVLLPEVQKFFESEEGQKEFREWKERQKQNSSKRRGIRFGRSALCCSQDISNRNDKSEPVPHLKDCVRIIIRWRRWRDLNPRAFFRRLLHFECRPFNHLGTSPYFLKTVRILLPFQRFSI